LPAQSSKKERPGFGDRNRKRVVEDEHRALAQEKCWRADSFLEHSVAPIAGKLLDVTRITKKDSFALDDITFSEAEKWSFEWERGNLSLSKTI
jgi:hypothetical protein